MIFVLILRFGQSPRVLDNSRASIHDGDDDAQTRLDFTRSRGWIAVCIDHVIFNFQIFALTMRPHVVRFCRKHVDAERNR